MRSDEPDQPDQPDDGVRDLDVADLAEVRRRVVDPVLAAMFRAGELDSVDLVVGDPHASPDFWLGEPLLDAPEVHLVLTARGESYSRWLREVAFWRWDADDIAQSLASDLSDWICETAFGWADLRGLPDGFAVPPAPPPPTGTRQLGVFAADAGDLPLWESAALADPEALGLSGALTADLRAWQQGLERFADAGQAAAEEADAARLAAFDDALAPGGAYRSGMTITYESTEERRLREAAYAAAAEEGRRSWRAYVDAFEPARDALLERLRAELGPGFHIPTPPRLP